MQDTSLPARIILTPAYRRNTSLALFLILFVPFIYAFGFIAMDVSLVWLAFGLGAAGWILAALLRGPLLALVHRPGISPERSQIMGVLISGPCEEVLRLLALLLIGRSFARAVSLGLGWTTIEIVYTAIHGSIALSLMSHQDEKARQARSLLVKMGMEKQLMNAIPLWGILERISASALHIGWTLLIAWQPLLVLLTIVLHSGTNVAAVALVHRSIVLMEYILLMAGCLILLAGLALASHPL